MKLFSLLMSFALMALLAGCETSSKKKKAASLPAKPQLSVPDASGFVTTRSGLKYKVLVSGPAAGRSPTRGDSVTVHYRGTLENGTVFDSSYDRGEPTTFGVGQVIPGWTEALQLMKPGDKWLLHIPFNLAYGNQAVGGKIPPYSDLIFQVELLRVIPAVMPSF